MRWSERRHYKHANLHYSEQDEKDKYLPKTRASVLTLLELFKDIGSLIIFPIGLLRLGYPLEGKAYEKIGRFFKVLISILLLHTGQVSILTTQAILYILISWNNKETMTTC